MTGGYVRFPTLGGAQRAVRQVVSLLGDGRPVITHCFAGKDKTGFTVATVLEAIGVDRDDALLSVPMIMGIRPWPLVHNSLQCVGQRIHIARSLG